MNQERKNILFLVSWYPNKTDHFIGDFIQRHAQAASLFHNVHVILVTGIVAPYHEEETFIENNGLSEQIIYFQKKEGLFGKVVNIWQWKKLYKLAILKYIKEKGRPNIVHVHVAWQSGLIALWLKRKLKIPYIITEHWGIFNRILTDNFYTKPSLFQYLIKLIFRQSAGLITVSEFIAIQINKVIPVETIGVVPNVVNTDLFFYKPEKNEVFTFIHVSGMVPLKNAAGIIRAYTIFKTKNPHVKSQLMLVGNPDADIKTAVNQSSLPTDELRLTGEVSYAEVAAYIQKAQCFILNSFMENSPCVIGEALCCGLPVISTNVGGVSELLSDENGILIPVNNDELLATAMESITKNYTGYNCLAISAKATKKFSYQFVGKKFSDFYEAYINSRQLL